MFKKTNTPLTIFKANNIGKNTFLDFVFDVYTVAGKRNI
jgi:hypothetical protein